MSVQWYVNVDVAMFLFRSIWKVFMCVECSNVWNVFIIISYVN